MVTKRQLGIILTTLGAAAAVAILMVDLMGAGEYQGLGPAQRLSLSGAVLLLLIGISLIPLGDRPA